jgi:hypothetical protein
MIGINSYTPSGGGGALPVVEVGNLLGVDVVYDFHQWEDKLVVISDAIMFLAYIYAFTIVMGKK